MTHLSPEAAARRLYILTCTRWLPIGLVVGIMILVQTERGLTIAQAATAAAVTGLVCFALELPTSGFADAVGRRPVYLTAAAVNVVAGLTYALAQTFWAFVVSAVLMGIFRALDSGPLEAWFVDTVHHSTPGADVDGQLAKAGTVLGGSIAIGAVLSGLLIWWDPMRRVFDGSGSALDVAVWTFVVLNVVHLIAAIVLMREPRRSLSEERTQFRHALAEGKQTPHVIASGLRLVGTNRVLLGIVLAEVFWSIGMITFETLMPLRLEEMLGSAQRAGALVGPVAAMGWGLYAAGSWLAGATSSRIGVARAAMLGRVLNATGAVVMGLVTGPVGLVVAYLFTYSMHGMNGPPHAALLHREAEARNRSTVLSINSMMAFLAFGIAAPTLGALADRTSISVAMTLAGALSIAGVFCYLPALRKERA